MVEFLDRLRALGVDERIVQVERDGWIGWTKLERVTGARMQPRRP
ncbi:hypothetical protein [Nonomuraea sp. NPDC050786]